MTIGGFTSTVRITRKKVTGGFVPQGSAYVRGEMELEGRLNVFHYGDLKERITRETKTISFIQIEFEESKDDSLFLSDYSYEDYNYENNDDNSKNYIGSIHLSEHKNDEDDFYDYEIIAKVFIVLPVEMLSHLSRMEKKLITFDAVYDIIKNPTENQKDNNTVAYIKRVYFETADHYPDEPEKKKWWFGR